jgi:hypothetical protein
MTRQDPEVSGSTPDGSFNKHINIGEKVMTHDAFIKLIDAQFKRLSDSFTKSFNNAMIKDKFDIADGDREDFATENFNDETNDVETNFNKAENDIKDIDNEDEIFMDCNDELHKDFIVASMKRMSSQRTKFWVTRGTSASSPRQRKRRTKASTS